MSECVRVGPSGRLQPSRIPARASSLGLAVPGVAVPIATTASAANAIKQSSLPAFICPREAKAFLGALLDQPRRGCDDHGCQAGRGRHEENDLASVSGGRAL